MNVLMVTKYPPLEGGVSVQSFSTAEALVRRGHRVTILTNAREAEPWFRCLFEAADEDRLSPRASRVQVTWSEPVTPGAYVPWAPPYLSQLLGRTLSALQGGSFDILVGSYLEPYGVAAALAGDMANIPVVLRCAGSDIGRLATHPDVQPTYAWALERARMIIGSAAFTHEFERLGVARNRVHDLALSRVPAYFGQGPPLAVEALAPAVADWYGRMPLPPDLREALVQGFDSWDPTRPTIGMYGKIAQAKGSFGLASALSELGDLDFNFVALCGGNLEPLREFLRIASSDLRRKSLLLPFLAPWRVPQFLALCDMVCVLEHQFPVPGHAPRIPEEILAAGACLICSREVASKQRLGKGLVHGRTYLCVEDPRDRARLADLLRVALTRPDDTADIGARGRSLLMGRNATAGTDDAFADLIEQAS